MLVLFFVVSCCPKADTKMNEEQQRYFLKNKIWINLFKLIAINIADKNPLLSGWLTIVKVVGFR